MGDQLRNYYKSSGERDNESLNKMVIQGKTVGIFRKLSWEDLEELRENAKVNMILGFHTQVAGWIESRISGVQRKEGERERFGAKKMMN